jgi:hypothetical protein
MLRSGERRIVISFPSQPREGVFETPSQWKKLVMVELAHHPSNSRKYKVGGS